MRVGCLQALWSEATTLLKLSRPKMAARYRVVGEDGAVVREGVELSTPVVGELRFGDEVTSAELMQDSRDATRVRLVRPIKGWATLRCFEQIESAESYAVSVERARLLERERREERYRVAVESQHHVDERPLTPSSSAMSVNALKDNQQRRGENSYYYAHYEKADDVTFTTTPAKITLQEHEHVTTSSSVPNSNALRSNLNQKGMSSYYYAHSRKDDGIRFETTPQKLDKASGDGGPLVVRTEFITDYSFSDEAERVVVRIPLKGALAAASEDDVHVEWTESSVKLEIAATPSCRAILRLPTQSGPFFRSISSVRSKRKPGRIVLFINR